MRSFVIAAAVLLSGCQLLHSPTEPRSFLSDCSDPGISDGVVRPLSPADVEHWQMVAVEFVWREIQNGDFKPPSQAKVDAFNWGVPPVPYDRFVWEPGWFESRTGICAAGLTEYPHCIYISTAEKNRTGRLVAHETTHWIFYMLGVKDGDPDHKLPYPS